MADLSGYTQFIVNILLSPFIWAVLIFMVFAGTFGILWIRKKRKLIYNCIELVKYRDDHVGINHIKAGWFGKKKYLRGLLDLGEEQLEIQGGDKVQNFSTEDFQEIDGKRGIVLVRDTLNPGILVPITKVNIEGMEMLAEIAPGEYTDAANDIINDADRETKDKMAQMINWVLMGGTIIFALISIILITQMVKQGQAEAKDLIVQAGETCLRNAKEVCSQIVTTVASQAP